MKACFCFAAKTKTDPRWEPPQKRTRDKAECVEEEVREVDTDKTEGEDYEE